MTATVHVILQRLSHPPHTDCIAKLTMQPHQVQNVNPLSIHMPSSPSVPRMLLQIGCTVVHQTKQWLTTSHRHRNCITTFHRKLTVITWNWLCDSQWRGQSADRDYNPSQLQVKRAVCYIVDRQGAEQWPPELQNHHHHHFNPFNPSIVPLQPTHILHTTWHPLA